MARKSQDDRKVIDLIREDEMQLIALVREAEQFTGYALERYGAPGWKEHLPCLANRDEWLLTDESAVLADKMEHTAKKTSVDDQDYQIVVNRPMVNLFTRFFMGGFSFQRHQAVAHYCPIPDIQIMGGVGAGKTHPVTISAITRASLNPGYRILWVAPILPQAKLAFDIVITSTVGKRWEELFLFHDRRHPYPLIELRQWDDYDPGGAFECRSLGQDPAEMLRGGEYDEAVADEAMRAFMTTWYIALISGRLRGPKPYMLSAFPELQEEYSEWVEAIEFADGIDEREGLRDALEEWVDEEGIAKQIRLTVIGNAPRGAEWWDRWEFGLANPDKRHSDRWTTYMNLYVTRKQLRLQEAQYEEGMEAQKRTELGAERPPAGGDIFPSLLNFFSDDLIREAIEAVEAGEPGWVLDMHPKWGLLHYEKPVDRKGAYIAALDPGSGQYPRRNKWVLLVARVDKNPNTGEQFEIVYMKTGNAPGEHGPDPWIHAAKDVRSRYPIFEGSFGVESSGVQKNTHHIVFGDDLVLNPIFLNNVVATLVIEAQRTVNADMWRVPYAVMFDNEMSEAKLAELRDKKKANDFFSAFLVLNHLTYALVQDRWNPNEEQEEEEEWEQVEVSHREVRTTGREVRRR